MKNIGKRAASRCLWRGMPRQRLKMFHKKMKSILKYISFLHRCIWCNEKIKEYLTFYGYFTRMQNSFHFRRWKFFFKKENFSGKKQFLFERFFVNIFSKVIGDNRLTHMISSLPFFIFRWQDTKWMRTEEDSFPISLILARTISVRLLFTNI